MLILMMVLPGYAADNKPIDPSKTSLTAASLDNMVKTTSQVSIKWRKLVAGFAPAASNGVSLFLVRLKTDTSKPALSRFITIGFPMFPSPVHPNFNLFMILVLNDAFPVLMLQSKKMLVYRSENKTKLRFFSGIEAKNS